MNYTIIDDYLPKEIAQEIEDYLIGPNAQFPWFYNQNVVAPGDGKMNLHNHQFTHVFYKNWQPHSTYFSIIEPIVMKINPKCLERIKANLNPVTDEKIVYDWHVDIRGINPYAKTAIYYVNTNNGVTMFEDGTEIESIANRLVVFDQNIRHTGTTCTDQKVRCLLNLNYIDNV